MNRYTNELYKKPTQTLKHSRLAAFIFGVSVISVFLLLAFVPREPRVPVILTPDEPPHEYYSSPGIGEMNYSTLPADSVANRSALNRSISPAENTHDADYATTCETHEEPTNEEDYDEAPETQTNQYINGFPTADSSPAESAASGDTAAQSTVSGDSSVAEGTQASHTNSNLAPCTYHLDEFFYQFGNNIGIYYKNLETGFTYTANADRVFFGASLNKANVALYTHIAAERGYIDMYAVHTFTANDWWGGTGIIRFMPAGTKLTTRELLYHSIVHSDNVAHRMLARYMNRIGFSYQDFVAELGANPDLIINAYSHNTSARDTAVWFYAMHTYFESSANYGHYLQHDMLNIALYSHPYFTRGTVFGGNDYINVQLMHSDYPIAKKYGWAVSSFNVAGIVYADSPFMLVIVSNMDNGVHDLFEEISWLMQEFNEKYF